MPSSDSLTDCTKPIKSNKPYGLSKTLKFLTPKTYCLEPNFQKGFQPEKVTRVNNYKQYNLLEKTHKAIYPNNDRNQTSSVAVLIFLN